MPKWQQSLCGDLGEGLDSSESFQFSGKRFLIVGCSDRVFGSWVICHWLGTGGFSCLWQDKI